MSHPSPRHLLARVVFAAVASASLLGFGAGNASASSLPELASSELSAASDACAAPAVQTVLASLSPLEPAAYSKSAAILGGAPSALDQIRLAQAGGETSASMEVLASTEPLPLAPAAGGIRPEPMECGSSSMVSTGFQRHASSAPAGEFLASRRLKIGHTSFDQAWSRVNGEAISGSQFERLVGHPSDDRLSTLRSVNQWVNQRIAYTEDADLFARSDFWAGAKRTLMLRQGDCEDIALTKMQLLAAAGIPKSDMILTIARDLVRNADHAVLIVRYNGQHYLLDNSTDEVLDASSSHDYRPVLSFSGTQAWLHGY